MEQEIKLLKQDEAKPEIPWIVPKRIDMRLIYLLSTVAPWVGFMLFGFDRFGSAEWQTGTMQTYFELSFAETVWVWFAPFLVYSSFSMLLLLWNADRFSHFWFVRFGIYTGVVLAIQFAVQTMFAGDLGFGFVIGVICIPLLFGLNWFINWLIGLIKRKRHDENFWKVAAGILLAVVVLWLGLYFVGFGGGPIAFLVIGPLAAGVALTPIFAGLTAYKLYRHIDQGNVENLVIKATLGIGWVAAYGFAAFKAIDRIFDLYTQLPTEPPHCYIATASAKGHRPLVNSTAVTVQNGETLLVTRQLQILKAGELVLCVLMPRFHKVMRVLYDSIGPKIARRIQGPWSADVGYLFFKPFELITLFFFKLLLPNQMRKIERFYLGL